MFSTALFLIMEEKPTHSGRILSVCKESALPSIIRYPDDLNPGFLYDKDILAPATL